MRWRPPEIKARPAASHTKAMTTTDKHTSLSHSESIGKLRELMKDIKFCMMTTVDSDGDLRSRPMTLQQSEFDGDLWFFTGKSTEKIAEIKQDQHVNVSFEKTDDNAYVSVSGRASFVEDREKAKELWSPFYRAWFPKGLDDPDLQLMKIHVTKAEYWDAPNGAVTYLFGLAKAMLTGKSPQSIGEHEKLRM